MKEKIIVIALTCFSVAFSFGQAKDTIDFPTLGGKYVGELNERGEPNGYGVLVSKFGGGYDGNWFNGVYHGRGKLTWATGDQYDGEWKNGLRDGNGEMIWARGDIYKGTWKEG